jgi:hypothetical protein
MEVPAMSDETKTLSGIEQMNAKHLREGTAVLVRRLRALADRIEHEAARNIEQAESGVSTYGQVVMSIEHELAWGFANLSAAQLGRSATEADIAHAKGD